MPDNEMDMTEFNSNKATLIRLDRWLRHASEAHFYRNLSEYHRHLKNIYKEVRPKMKRDSEKGSAQHETEEEKDERHSVFRECGNLYWNQLDNYETVSGYDSSISKKYEQLLVKFEMMIRDYADKKGMLLKDGKMDEL